MGLSSRSEQTANGLPWYLAMHSPTFRVSWPYSSEHWAKMISITLLSVFIGVGVSVVVLFEAGGGSASCNGPLLGTLSRVEDSEGIAPGLSGLPPATRFSE